MFIAFLIVTVFALTGIQVTLGRECCYTGFNDYTWCATYCCIPTYSWSSYYRCCSTYSEKALFTASSSNCSSFFEENVWVPILIALGCLGVVVGIIVCCVCCMKGCMASNRTGTVVSNPGQPPNTAMAIVSSNATPVKNITSQQGMFGGGPAHVGGTQDQQGIGYPPQFAAPSLEISKPSVSTNFDRHTYC